jgi:oxygen-independent coproporphyrinogen-3 oxidase
MKPLPSQPLATPLVLGAGEAAAASQRPSCASAERPQAAYVHVPFCRHRCGYCNFTLVAGRDDLIESYLAALQRELSWLGQPQPVQTLFVGGGTPTHLPAAQLARLLALLQRWFPLLPGGEWSVEANPVDLDAARLDVLGQAGITRISLGVQSLAPHKLAVLERDHDAACVARAVATARQVAASVSLDLIFGVPGETLADWHRDLQAALDLQPDHLSTYGLTWEKGARFWARRLRGQLAPLDEETERAMYEAAIDRLTAAGMEHYEVSNFARPGHRCRHTEVYWRREPFFGVGPGAARLIGGRREVNHRSTTMYLRRVLAGQSPVQEAEQLGPEDAARERLVLGLRQMEGVDLAAFQEATGFSVFQLGGEALLQMLRQGLLELTDGRLRLTRQGLLVSDALWPAFVRV